MTGIIPKEELTGRAATAARPVAYAWLVFALTFGLLISDYMARQVLNAVFPLLKTEWALSDTQLGMLSGVVALMVGLLTFPLSLLADRLGRIRSLTAMAVMWSLATLLCGIAGYQNARQPHPRQRRQAAYGSVGIAVVVSVFPRSLRATAARLHGHGLLDRSSAWAAAASPPSMAGGPPSSPSAVLGLAMLYPARPSAPRASPRRAR